MMEVIERLIFLLFRFHPIKVHEWLLVCFHYLRRVSGFPITLPIITYKAYKRGFGGKAKRNFLRIAQRGVLKCMQISFPLKLVFFYGGYKLPFVHSLLGCNVSALVDYVNYPSLGIFWIKGSKTLAQLPVSFAF
jgi:hypothetical protein